jgi:hypothetical protein
MFSCESNAVSFRSKCFAEELHELSEHTCRISEWTQEFYGLIWLFVGVFYLNENLLEVYVLLIFIELIAFEYLKS